MTIIAHIENTFYSARADLNFIDDHPEQARRSFSWLNTGVQFWITDPSYPLPYPMAKRPPALVCLFASFFICLMLCSVDLASISYSISGYKLTAPPAGPMHCYRVTCEHMCFERTLWNHLNPDYLTCTNRQTSRAAGKQKLSVISSLNIQYQSIFSLFVPRFDFLESCHLDVLRLPRD